MDVLLINYVLYLPLDTKYIFNGVASVYNWLFVCIFFCDFATVTGTKFYDKIK